MIKCSLRTCSCTEWCYWQIPMLRSEALLLNLMIDDDDYDGDDDDADADADADADIVADASGACHRPMDCNFYTICHSALRI